MMLIALKNKSFLGISKETVIYHFDHKTQQIEHKLVNGKISQLDPQDRQILSDLQKTKNLLNLETIPQNVLLSNVFSPPSNSSNIINGTITEVPNIHTQYTQELFNYLLKKYNRDFERTGTLEKEVTFTNGYNIKFTMLRAVRNKTCVQTSIQTRLFHDNICGNCVQGQKDEKVASSTVYHSYFLGGIGDSLKSSLQALFKQIAWTRPCYECGKVTAGDFSDKYDCCENCILSKLVTKKPQQFCSICQEFTTNYYTTICNHHYHRRCLTLLDHIPTEHKKCPLCSAYLNMCGVI